jgi:hypothetical protein
MNEITEVKNQGERGGAVDRSAARQIARLLRSEGRAGLELRHVSKERTEITIKRIIGRSIRVAMMEDSMEVERPVGSLLYQVSGRGFMASMGLTQDRLPRDFSYNPWVSRGTEETQAGVKAIRTLLPNIASIIERYPKTFQIYRSSDYPWDTDFV